MTSRRIAQNNQQQKSEKAQGSGILQRAGVRSVSEVGVKFEEQEALVLTNSAFSKDFSQVLIRTTQAQQNTPANVQSREIEIVQRQEISEASSEDSGLYGDKKENKTGLPNKLKAGIENFSGYSMDDVRVHYNSSKPAHLQALAYTQGTNIYVAPGEEETVRHEIGHVVQQKQGRVKPTMQMRGVEINDDEGLEKEADEIGKKAIQNSTIRPQSYEPRLFSTRGEKQGLKAEAQIQPRRNSPALVTIQRMPVELRLRTRQNRADAEQTLDQNPIINAGINLNNIVEGDRNRRPPLISSGHPHLVSFVYNNQQVNGLNPGNYWHKVKIRYQGSRDADFQLANRMVNLDATPQYAVWHHYHDYNETTNEGTLYLMPIQDHQQFHHGGVWMWEQSHPNQIYG